MARIFIDGFDHGSTDLWDIDAGVVLDSNGEVTGDYSISGSYYVEKTIGASGSVYVSFREYLEAAGASWVVAFYDGSGNLQGSIALTHQASGTRYKSTITVKNDDESQSETYEYYTDRPLTQHIQVGFVNASTTNKTVQVKVDNIQKINTSIVNVSADSTTTEAVRITPNVCHVDDVVIDDASWPGAPYVYTLSPSTDGTQNQWTPTTGSDNFAMVDEIPPNETDYVETGTADDIDQYQFDDLPDTDDWTVGSVQVSAQAKTPGPPADENLQLVVRTGGTDYFSGSKVLSTSFAPVANIWEDNPNTSAAWTQDQVNSGEFGIKAKA